MSREVAAIVGSGTVPFVYGILDPSDRGSQPGAEGVRTGIQVIIANPEDSIAVDAFVVSGVSIGTTPVQIWGPGINSLPRQRVLIMHNDGPGEVYFGQNSTAVIAPSGMHLHVGAGAGTLQQISLPFMYNVQVWARSDSTASIRILAY